ncbi:MAG: (2Fe-2S) ferredoxin domain-containing protein [Desulfobacteraceae bacterium]|nr:(2Fe-2S) ferredoxin domain-containing protein [Desulfobacteraceae bacterium]
MGRITVEDLQKIKEKTRGRIALRRQESTARITVHIGDCGLEAGARDVMKALLEEIKKAGRQDIHIFAGDCLGICETEPNITVDIMGGQPVVYREVDAEKARRIFQRHVINGEVQHEDTVEVPAAEPESEPAREGQ